MTVLKAGPQPLPGLAEFLTQFAELLTRRENLESLERYSTGLLSDINRKTADGMGRELHGTSGVRLQEFFTNTKWDPRAMDRLRVERMVRDASVGEGVLIIDDTGIPKKGRHSVGVSRQYSGTLGRIDNCQVLVTAHYADRLFDWPITGQIYLPESWAEDQERRVKAKVPDNVEFQTKTEIGLALIDWSVELGVPVKAVVVDAGYGQSTGFLSGLEERELPYVAAAKSTTRFRDAAAVEADSGVEEVPPRTGLSGRPRKPKGLEDRVPAQNAQELLDADHKRRWTKVVWREGKKGALAKRVKAIRVYRVGSRGKHIPSCGWVIERFYLDAKGELGLDDYEGRLWTGFHRHVALVMLCHSYLTLRQPYAPVGNDTASGSSDPTPARPPDMPGRGLPP